MSKHLHPGKAAFNGILSADLARAGFTGAKRILEGERGFLRAMSTSFDVSRITDGLGEAWKITENCYKVHSCCGHTHSAIDVALDVRSQQKWSTEDVAANIRDIHIETYGPGFEDRERRESATRRRKRNLVLRTVCRWHCLKAALDWNSLSGTFAPDGVSDRRIAAILRRARDSGRGVNPEIPRRLARSPYHHTGRRIAAQGMQRLPARQSGTPVNDQSVRRQIPGFGRVALWERHCHFRTIDSARH